MKIGVLMMCLFVLSICGNAQQDIPMTLNEMLVLVDKQSLDIVRGRNIYQASYWEYRSYRSSLLPQAKLRLQPFTFNRSMTQRYDVNENIEVFRLQQTLNSYLSLAITQNIGTGGQIFVDSDLNSLVNFGANDLRMYSMTPVRVGIIQPIFAYNAMKWQRQLAPLKFERAKKEFISGQQNTYLKAIRLYFELLFAFMRKEEAENNLKTSSDLYEIGKGRFAITSINRKDLLELELTKHNSDIKLSQADKSLSSAMFNFCSFLGFEKGISVLPVAPEIIHDFKIDIDESLEYALQANPDLLEWDQNKLEATMDVEKVVRGSRISIDLAASYGLNQQDSRFNKLLDSPLAQQLVAIDINVPLLDWGERRGKREMVQKQKDVVDIEIRQARIDFEQEVILKVTDFNLQERLIQSAVKANEIAVESYMLTEKRFRTGQTDVMELTAAMTARQQAREDLITSLYSYWTSYYEIRKLTLFDFLNHKWLE